MYGLKTLNHTKIKVARLDKLIVSIAAMLQGLVAAKLEDRSLRLGASES
jgi:hypothetical protein